MVQVVSGMGLLINWINEKTEPRRLWWVAGEGVQGVGVGRGGGVGCQVVIK